MMITSACSKLPCSALPTAGDCGPLERPRPLLSAAGVSCVEGLQQGRRGLGLQSTYQAHGVGAGCAWSPVLRLPCHAAHDPRAVQPRGRSGAHVQRFLQCTEHLCWGHGPGSCQQPGQHALALASCAMGCQAEKITASVLCSGSAGPVAHAQGAERGRRVARMCRTRLRCA